MYTWLTIIFLSALPVTELRASLPLAIWSFHTPPALALLLVWIGNILPLFFIFWLLPPLIAWAQKHSPVLHRLLDTHLRKLERKHEARYHRWGSWFLFLLVTVPLPGSGVWTGSMLAVLFGMKPRPAVLAITLGMIASGLIVLFLTLHATSV